MDDPAAWADRSPRMDDCAQSLKDWPEGRPIDLEIVATMLRCSYAAGYSDALANERGVGLAEARVAEARFRLALP